MPDSNLRSDRAKAPSARNQLREFWSSLYAHSLEPWPVYSANHSVQLLPCLDTYPRHRHRGQHDYRDLWPQSLHFPCDCKSVHARHPVVQPAATRLGGISRRTTLPAPITLLSPIVMPGQMTAMSPKPDIVPDAYGFRRL
jgi:hypothetical protein